MATYISAEDKLLMPFDRMRVTEEINNMVEHMYETVLDHKGDFRKAMQVHLFCMIDGDDRPIYITNEPKRGGNQHAEELLIKELEKRLTARKTKLTDVTVYISNSPCSSDDHNCTKKLRDFLKKYQTVSLIVFVTHLYKILRMSCETHRHILDDDYFANTCGLWNLMHHERCSVRSYDGTVWKQLLDNKYLMFSEEVKNQLLNEYHEERFLNDKRGDIIGKNDRSRQYEDQLTKKDLDAIGVKILNQIFGIKLYNQHFRSCLICVIDDGWKTIKLAKCDQREKHAVELLLEELRELKIEDRELIIFMNNTPCSLPLHYCADKLIQFIKAKQVKLTLYVTRLCEAKEETCSLSENEHSNCGIRDETALIAGLVRLKNQCTVKGPSKNAWKKIFDIMNTSDSDMSIREFWENYEEANCGTSRKEENKRIRSYLNKI